MFQLPTPADVRNLLSMTLGRDVGVRPAPNRLPAGTAAAVAVYVGDDGGPLALAGCDLRVGGSLAAALALVSKSRVQEAVNGGQLPVDLAANLHEVFNVGAASFNGPNRPHVRLSECHLAPAIPSGLLDQLAGMVVRLDLQVEVPGYGEGPFVLVAV